MSTFIINLNDTIALSDSAVVELAKVAGAWHPCVQEAETSCNDVWIVVAVCLTIIAVALIAKCAVLSWQKATIASKERERNDKKAKEKEEYERKKEADKTNRDWRIDDEERKRKYSLDDEERKRKYTIEDEERKLKPKGEEHK